MVEGWTLSLSMVTMQLKLVKEKPGLCMCFDWSSCSINSVIVGFIVCVFAVALSVSDLIPVRDSRSDSAPTAGDGVFRAPYPVTSRESRAGRSPMSQSTR